MVVREFLSATKSVFLGKDGTGRELRLRMTLFTILNVAFIATILIYIFGTLGYGMFTAPLIYVGLLLFFVDSLLFSPVRKSIDELSERTFISHSALVVLRAIVFFIVGLLCLSGEVVDFWSISGLPILILAGLQFFLLLVLDFAIILSRGSYLIVISTFILWSILYWTALSPGRLFQLSLLPEETAQYFQSTSWFTPLPSPRDTKNNETDQYEFFIEVREYGFRNGSFPERSGVIFFDSKNERVGAGFSEKGKLRDGTNFFPLTFIRLLEHGEILTAQFFTDKNADMQLQEVSEPYYRRATGDVYALTFRALDFQTDREVKETEYRKRVSKLLVVQDTDIVIGNIDATIKVFKQFKIPFFSTQGDIFYWVNMVKEYVVKKQNQHFAIIFRPVLSSSIEDKVVASQLHCVADQKRFIEIMDFIQMNRSQEPLSETMVNKIQLSETIVNKIQSGIDTLDIDKGKLGTCMEKNAYDFIKVYDQYEKPEEFVQRDYYLMVNGVLSDEHVYDEGIEKHLQQLGL